MIKSIKFLWQDFVAFIRADFKPLPYIYALTVIALSIVIAYNTDFGKSISRGYAPFPSEYKYVNSILMYSFLYFLVAVPILIMQGKYRSINKWHFYLKGFTLTAILGFTDVFSWFYYLDISKFNDIKEIQFLSLFLWSTKALVFQLPVLLLLRFWIDRKVKGLYGICRGNHHVKAYLWLYVIILPILIVTAFTQDFQDYYPICKPWYFGADTALTSAGLFGLPVGINLLMLEFAYISTFFMVELLFRGAFVIGMGSAIERSAVLPMVAVYVALHFGKPVLETMSAIFGGFALGVLAYQSRHIWGGVIIHMGIAFAIEVIRHLQYYILGIR